VERRSTLVGLGLALVGELRLELGDDARGLEVTLR